LIMMMSADGGISPPQEEFLPTIHKSRALVNRWSLRPNGYNLYE
jgi:hypothetical protein